MSLFRLVVLDNAKEQLDSDVAQKLLSDMLFVKQKNFLRTDPHYVVMDKHDMIGTHYLIYETTDILNPRLIFAMRTTFLSRAQEHRLETPLMSLIPKMEPALQEAFRNFHRQHPELVDCNAWFVDPEFSKKSSGLNLSDVGYLMVWLNIRRFGYDNMVGCTNETYNASRWLERLGTVAPGMLFEHPAVKSVHKMILLDQFNQAHFSEVYEKHRELLSETFEVMPVRQPTLPSLYQMAEELLGGGKVIYMAKASVA